MIHFWFWILLCFSPLSIYEFLFLHFLIHTFRMNFPFCLSPSQFFLEAFLNESLGFTFSLMHYILWCATLPILDFCISSFNVFFIWSVFPHAAPLSPCCSLFVFKMPLHISILQLLLYCLWCVFPHMSTCLWFWAALYASDVIFAHLIIYFSIISLYFFQFFSFGIYVLTAGFFFFTID